MMHFLLKKRIDRPTDLINREGKGARHIMHGFLLPRAVAHQHLRTIRSRVQSELSRAGCIDAGLAATSRDTCGESGPVACGAVRCRPQPPPRAGAGAAAGAVETVVKSGGQTCGGQIRSTSERTAETWSNA